MKIRPQFDINQDNIRFTILVVPVNCHEFVNVIMEPVINLKGMIYAV